MIKNNVVTCLSKWDFEKVNRYKDKKGVTRAEALRNLILKGLQVEGIETPYLDTIGQKRINEFGRVLIEIYGYVCYRCGCSWIQKTEEDNSCPNCSRQLKQKSQEVLT